MRDERIVRRMKGEGGDMKEEGEWGREWGGNGGGNGMRG